MGLVITGFRNGIGILQAFTIEVYEHSYECDASRAFSQGAI